jgi:hypothetical protein
MNYNHQAIRKVYPDANLLIEDGIGITDQTTGQEFIVDQTLVDAAAAEIQAELDATQYQRDRQPEYPSLADLADALYWSNQGDNTKLDEYYAACAAVKAKYPKPEVN